MTNPTHVLISCAWVAFAVLAGGCAMSLDVPPHLKPLSHSTMSQLGAREMRADSPIFIRIFKAESELEVWKQRPDGRYHHFKTYPICTWSGELGPKRKQGDKQAPEGFYLVNRHRMNPNSSYHLSFNLGYPNAFDRAHGRTGNFLMVHGKCTSAGCYAMTDPLIEEIYALAREAFIGGQSAFWVHAFPFRMTDENMLRFATPQYEKHQEFWATLKQAHDIFERTRVPPPIAVCERRYVVNAVAPRGVRVHPRGRCPRFERPQIADYVVADPDADAKRMVARGPKKRRAFLARISAGGQGSGLTQPPRLASPAPIAPRPFRPSRVFGQAAD